MLQLQFTAHSSLTRKEKQKTIVKFCAIFLRKFLVPLSIEKFKFLQMKLKMKLIESISGDCLKIKEEK
jgi:hypothetical protein